MRNKTLEKRQMIRYGGYERGRLTDLWDMTEIFELLKASLFTEAPVEMEDWEAVFTEMKNQAVAALPGEWLKTHLDAPPWMNYCYRQQAYWIKLMHEQDQLIRLLKEHGIPCVIIKGAAAAMYYPHPTLRTMGDIDVLVKRGDLGRAAGLLEGSEYRLTCDKAEARYHYNYSKHNISIELHKRLPVIDDESEELLSLFEDGIDRREWRAAESFCFPVLPVCLNGLVLIFHMNQHLRDGLGLRQIVDWMMYVDSLLPIEWEELRILLKQTGMERFALTSTVMCQKYLGLRQIVEECEDYPTDALMDYLLEQGNFGRKVGVDGRIASFSLATSGSGGFFRELQKRGLNNWKAAKKYKGLRPFAWIYQSFRMLGKINKNRIGAKKIWKQYAKGREQKELLEALGLNADWSVVYENDKHNPF